MITPEVWKKNVIVSVQHIADKAFQESAWFGNLEGVFSSPIEVYCQLFDDDDIEDFLKSDEIGLSVSQKEIGCKLVQKINEFGDKIGDMPTAERVLSDPEWDDVRSAARAFLKELTGENA